MFDQLGEAVRMTIKDGGSVGMELWIPMMHLMWLEI